MNIKALCSAICNPRIVVIALLAFASGLPFSLSSSTLQVWMADLNIDIKTIGLMGLVGIPYVTKFLWAPLMDRYIPPFLGRRRSWMLLTQMGLMFLLAAIAYVNPLSQLLLISGLAFFVAFLSASQDIVIDAYRADVLEPEERGMGVAVTVAGYRVAIIMSGAIAMAMAYYVGWRSTYLFMAAIMGACMIVTLLSPEPHYTKAAPPSLREAIINPFKQFMSRRNAILLLLLILFYNLGEAALSSLVSPFLVQGIGFDLHEVAAVNKAFGITLTILGAFVGGVLLTRMSLFQGLLYFGVLQAVANLMFVWLALVGKDYSVFLLAVFAQNFFGGLGTSAYFALLLSLCDKRYSATQYALFSALFGAVRVAVSPIAGFVVSWFGWAAFFFGTFLAAIPALYIVWYLRNMDELTLKVAEVN